MTVTESKLTEIMNDLYLIYHGVRDCCMHTISADILEDEEFMNSIKKEAEFYKVKYTITDFTDENDLKYKTIFFYMYDHQKVMYLITESIPNNGNPLNGYASQYIIGKLLGYSNRDMEEYLDKLFDTSEIMESIIKTDTRSNAVIADELKKIREEITNLNYKMDVANDPCEDLK